MTTGTIPSKIIYRIEQVPKTKDNPAGTIHIGEVHALKNPYNEGYDAARRSVHYHNNPYTETGDMLLWMEGWLSFEQDD